MTPSTQSYGSIPTTTNTSPTTKQGHACCGGCCDVRRACIIVNGISISLFFLNLCVLVAIQHVTFDDDDALQQHSEWQETVSTLPTNRIVLFSSLGILLLGIATYGALQFQVKYVLVGLVFYGVDMILCLLPLNPLGLILSACFAYPHYFLVCELIDGSMNRETYVAVEEQCCCCV